MYVTITSPQIQPCADVVRVTNVCIIIFFSKSWDYNYVIFYCPW